MVSSHNARVILTTVGSSDEAAHIARTLVHERLAACVNLVPGVLSVYSWMGSVHEDQEWLLVIKTNAAHVQTLEARLKGLQSYETPEFLVLVPESGSEAYLLWIDESVSQVVREGPSSI